MYTLAGTVFFRDRVDILSRLTSHRKVVERRLLMSVSHASRTVWIARSSFDMLKRSFLFVSLISLIAACSSTVDTTESSDKGEPVAPPADGKMDVAERIIDKGELGFGPENAVSAAFDEDLQFYGWHLHVRAGASVTLEVTQKGSSRNLDTTLYVYGPKTSSGGYGTTALGFDDDTGWGRLSRITEHSFHVAGEYLVVVGTYDGRGRGNFRLQATCLSGDCSPEAKPEPVVTDCHADIANAILACVEAKENSSTEDVSTMTRQDLIEACTTPEQVASAWEKLCAQSSAPSDVCASFEEFSSSYLPACGRELIDKTLDTTCVFGTTYPDIWNRPGAVVVLEQRVLSQSDVLSPLEQQQVIAAVKSSAHSEVSSIDEAFAAADGGIVYQTQLWDASHRKPYTSVELGAGDNSFGLIFDFGTVQPVATINDSDILECKVFWGSEMRPCKQDEHCAGELSCTGVAEELEKGRCIDTSKDEHPVNGTECSDQEPCPEGTGFVCAGGFMCNPAWMRGRFVSRPNLPIPDANPNGADATIVAYGLTTVSTDVALDLHITHERPSDLVVSVINPEGTEVVVFDKKQGVNEIFFDSLPVEGFPGDESANGVWTVRAVDTKTGSTGIIRSFSLTITSRWD
jgi:hypothetical protein